MREESMLGRLRQREVLLGLRHVYPTAGIIEGMAQGWDFVWIDVQHGQLSYDSVLSSIRAAELMGIDTLLRVPTHESGTLGLFADMRPSSLMIPLVNRADQARGVVSSLRFAPQGTRSYGGRRVIDLEGIGYYRSADTPLVVAQIETLGALKNVEAIARVEGVGVLFFGGDDMKISMGLPIEAPDFETPQVVDAMKRVAGVARAAGKALGRVATTKDEVEQAIAMGYQLIVGGSDVGFLVTGARQRVTALRAAAREATLPDPAPVHRTR
jgi:4-hydroxy-2-oxoheptanedioate aldolase